MLSTSLWVILKKCSQFLKVKCIIILLALSKISVYKKYLDILYLKLVTVYIFDCLQLWQNNCCRSILLCLLYIEYYPILPLFVHVPIICQLLRPLIFGQNTKFIRSYRPILQTVTSSMFYI